MIEINVLGVLGAGQMGAGIAQIAAQSGLTVLLADMTIEQAQRAKDKLNATLAKLVEKGKLSASDHEAAIARVTPVGSMDALHGCDLVIEAVTENVEVKLEIFRKLDAAVQPTAILASNTSSISVTKIASVTQRPERVIGMHFMNPVPLMKLVEIIRALQTSDETYAATVALSSRMNKTVVTAQDAPGFIVNRVLIPLLNEACFALEQGVGAVRDIDDGVKLGLNHPMGPLELADLIGLDTVLAIAEVLQRDLGEDKYRPANILRKHVAAGWLGRKTGRGFYRYEGGQRV
ncbi:MAG: 3-hydroxybutyryl-CoA dehydrogenase [Deltaproteobacteria bacterium]|nr:3-hydroxybutyryl-CoA dehydrogenase [Deltaproteobacteria bacterium]